MTPPGYPAARVAAIRVHAHFAASQQEEGQIAFVPDIETIESIIDVAFWASLRREEIYTPRISLALVSPGQVKLPLAFEWPVPLASQPLSSAPRLTVQKYEIKSNHCLRAMRGSLRSVVLQKKCAGAGGEGSGSGVHQAEEAEAGEEAEALCDPAKGDAHQDLQNRGDDGD